MVWERKGWEYFRAEKGLCVRGACEGELGSSRPARIWDTDPREKECFLFPKSTALLMVVERISAVRRYPKDLVQCHTGHQKYQYSPFNSSLEEPNQEKGLTAQQQLSSLGDI